MLFAPYHAVVRRILRAAFADISSGNGARVARQFSDSAEFRFYGDHELGGELHGRTAIADWFERLHRLFPGIRITPLQIVVNGTPWNTTVATRFAVDAVLPDGSPYHNDGMQYMRIACGRIIEDRLYEDTELLKLALRTIETGVEPPATASAP
jgi:ketosteroid isomerase-like protein